MDRQRIMLMSGFLGSGKTTSMVAMGRELEKRGLEIGLITNDLGENLVDTNFVNSNGFPVQEISNGCLCHDVDQLVEKIGMLEASVNPEIVLFEPVGSCIDMVEHVYRDIDKRFSEHYILAPVTALVDPVRYQAIYMGKGTDTFPEQISYMFKKQLEEADLLLISKADTLSDDEIEQITQSIHENFPGIETFPISSIEEMNIDRWADHVLSHTSNRIPIDIDMDYVMDGAAYMGWYNWVCGIRIPDPTDIAALCVEYLGAVRDAFLEQGGEIAHAKVLAMQEDLSTKAAITTKDGTISSVGDLHVCTGDVELRINIRAIKDAQDLACLMEGKLRELLSSKNITIYETRLQAFTSADEAPAPRRSQE